MRHRKHTFKVGRRRDHVRSMLANQAVSVILEGRIETTVVKAKEARRLVEKLITLGKKGTLHHRRRAVALLRQNTRTKHLIATSEEKPVPAKQLAVRKLFSELAPRYMDRPGGYTRIIRTGTRRGDAAEMCFLELVEGEIAPKKAAKKAEKAVEAAPVVEEEAVAEAAVEVAEEAEVVEEAAVEVAEAAAEEPAAEATEEAAEEEKKSEG